MNISQMGSISLLFFSRQTGNLGWVLLGIGVVLVFLSGGVILKPTSLWSFKVAFADESRWVSADNAGKTQILGLVEGTSLGNFPRASPRARSLS